LKTFKELDNELLGGLGRLGLLPGQIGGDGASGGRGVIRLEIVFQGHGGGIENDDVVAVGGVVLVVVEAVFGVESEGLGLGLFHSREVRRGGRRRRGGGSGGVAGG
jgi:hypothetical protein